MFVLFLRWFELLTMCSCICVPWEHDVHDMKETVIVITIVCLVIRISHWIYKICILFERKYIEIMYDKSLGCFIISFFSVQFLIVRIIRWHFFVWKINDYCMRMSTSKARHWSYNGVIKCYKIRRIILREKDSGDEFFKVENFAKVTSPR